MDDWIYYLRKSLAKDKMGQALNKNNMRLEESLKIQSIIKKHAPFKNIINLGSGNVEQLKKTKP